MINSSRWSHLPGHRVIIGNSKGTGWSCGGRVVCKHHSDRPECFQWYDQNNDRDSRRWVLNNEIHSWLVDRDIAYKFDLDVVTTISEFGFEVYDYIWMVIIDDNSQAMLTKLTWGV